MAEDGGGGKSIAAKDHTKTTILDQFKSFVVGWFEFRYRECILKLWTDEAAVETGAEEWAEARGAGAYGLQVGHGEHGAWCAIGKKGRGGHAKSLEWDAKVDEFIDCR